MWCVETDHGAVVGPRAELHGALLVVEGKPRDVDLARRLEKREMSTWCNKQNCTAYKKALHFDMEIGRFCSCQV